ncbi:hypothetical protein EMIHUDRAFT_450890 [Emiliania huxleyi CCMP1516]|uniref:Minichromosome loss protein Mcl1 middle region domain-containing protein n=2 Tax=Emiliania huxleyi TaxID=2903 RepID=A0A0D3JBY4_EMIH1|nr:hypothetical protein EMIHUDRAFT_450890 [Emiliania huxleyi CCMP1516]EOD21019.1 hypothetical protein EMIHUDRAFT_450890 [Emiliania huxleyi CCMP1516]|eukprot:XP_005773448.1 hypothetical protein EMIHUDRAFT_450890 [Emiliania huxleyi CCMP1516]
MPLDKGVHLKCAHTEGRGAISYAPDGRHIVTCGKDTFVKIFEAEELSAEPRTLEIHDAHAPVTALAMDRKGARVVTGTDAHIASVFSYPSGEGMRMLTRMQSAVRCIALDPKGRIAAVGAEDGAIRMCMVNASGAGASQFVSVKGHTDSVLCLAFDPKGEYLASSSADGTVRIWDIRDDPTTVKTLSVCGRVLPRGSAQQLGVCWHPQGETLAVPKGAGAILLDRGTWEETATFESGGAGKDGHSEDVSTTAFSPNGRYLATAGLDKQVFVWDAACGESLDRHRGDATPCGLCWSPTANTLCFLDDSGQLGIWVVHDSDDGGFSDHDDDETPSATPLRNSRRFLLWNLTGMVLSRDENTYSAIEVEFSDATKHRTMRLTDHYGFSMAALDEAAVLVASRSNHGKTRNPSTVVYRPLASWAPNSDWQVQLEKGEEAVAVAVGHKFALVATSARYLRVYSHTGAPRSLLCHGGPLVALAASRGLAALALLVTLYDLREPARPVRLASELLPLSPGATLDWVGFSEAGALSTVDSAGVAEHHWVVGLTGAQLMCILCKGDDKYPATLPRPVLTALPLAMPLACSEPAEPQLEAQRIAAMVELDEYRLAATEAGLGEEETAEHTMRLVTKIDSLALKLFKTANETERNARALDLALSLQLPKSLHGAPQTCPSPCRLFKP